MTIEQKLEGVRAQMRTAGVHACIIADVDPHQSEYVADRYRCRTWISGFSGSAGTVVVTLEDAGLWTDSRYFLEAEAALSGTSITLFKDGMPGVPPFIDWICSRLVAGQAVGIDDAITSITQFRSIQAACRTHGISVNGGFDPIRGVWTDRPQSPLNRIFAHDERFAGQSRVARIAAVRHLMDERKVDCFLTAALDDVAWLFNIRGSDVAYNPVALAYAAVTPERALLFIDAGKVPDEVRAALVRDGVELAPYDSIAHFVPQLGSSGAGNTIAVLSLPPDRISFRLLSSVPETVRVVEETSYVTKLKARKNPTEQDNLRATMVRDGVAMERFFYWLEASAGKEPLTEVSVARQLLEVRARDERFMGESFKTIAGFGAHGAIVHYGATEETDVPITVPGLLLLDSGGQYLDGTTDITRVVPLGPAPEQAIIDYTTVLKAHIALATAEFPEGTSGPQLDTIARSVLWRSGMTYGHGTGHGVGYFLNVHEGPQRIGAQPQAVPLETGMFISNEPGVYRTGEHGIRIENLVLVQEGRTTGFGKFLRFETITLCHLEPDLIDIRLLDKRELDWLNGYQTRVFEALGPHLSPNEQQWLRRKTRTL